MDWRSRLWVLFALSCAPDDPVHQGGLFDDAWRREVGARMADDALSFTFEDLGYSARAGGLDASFDLEGAELLAGLRVTTARWGRAGRAERIDAEAPRLGACVAGRTAPDGACIQRLEWSAPDLTIWWAATPDGLQQGWSVPLAPPGSGALVVEVAVDGATVRVVEHELWLEAEGGEAIQVAGLVAWDAAGRSLAAEFRPLTGGFQVVVDDDGAVYPVEIDPVYSSATAALIGTADEGFGNSVAAAGDVDADGYDDVVVGASEYSGQTGRVYVYHGTAAGLETTALATLTGPRRTSRFGISARGAGDVNNDGYDDVIVGAWGVNSLAGEATVYHGSASGLATTAATTIAGAAAADYLGYAVASAGDVNGDGYDDVIVGASGVSSGLGLAYLHRGSASGVSATASTTLTGLEAAERFGFDVAGAGDVNGDGYDDVVVGAYQYGSRAGRVLVYHGAAGGLSSSAASTFSGASNELLGWSVAGVGDVNSDGYDDVIAGAPLAGSSAGSVYLCLGSRSGITTCTNPWIGENAGDELGESVGGAGDVNGDGHADVLVGAPSWGGGAGRAELYEGGSTMPPTLTLRFEGVASDDGLGSSVAGAGDLNADGYDDVLIGGESYAGGDGRVQVHLGYIDADGDGYAAVDDCDDQNADAHPGAAEVCDPDDVDEDCNGDADDDDSSTSGLLSFYTDSDGDGYGTGSATRGCDAVSGQADNDDDCDDTDSAIHPGATEVCDPAATDEDCDSVADDDDDSVSGQSTWYLDADGDGYGGSTQEPACIQPASTTTTADDCDDTDAAISPSAAEACDGADTDENCDGVADDTTATGLLNFYIDADGDGYGSATPVLACDLPEGAAISADDCDDSTAERHPGATELCDDADLDEDCDGAAENADPDSTNLQSYWVDADLDGIGGSTPVSACDLADGIADRNDDCDDSHPGTYPGGTEVCDEAEADEDCDGLIDDLDDSATGQTSWYPDLDGDGYGGEGGATTACDAPAGTGPGAEDCDDGDPALHPGADEADCTDPVDYNCDGVVAFSDTDADGYAACEDCNDNNVTVRPGGTETCNGDDDDCDGTVDEDGEGSRLWYADADGDGWTDNDSTVTTCNPPEGYGESTAHDCNDADPLINPAAAEVTGDNTDQNCDGEDAQLGQPVTEKANVDTCGCDSGAGPSAVLGLLGLLGLRRRRDP